MNVSRSLCQAIRIVVVGLSLAWGGCAPAASADDSEFSSAVLHYLKYSQLVEENPGQKFVLGKPLVLTVKGTAQAQEFFRQAFQIRVFRVEGQGKAPVPLVVYKPCIVVLSSHYRFPAGVRDSLVSIGTLDSIGWLTAEDGKPLSPGKYLLVFEKLNEEKDLLRIDTKLSGDYFGGGLYVEVHPDPRRQYPQVEINREAQESQKHLAALMPIARDNDKAYVCFNGRRLTDADELFQTPELLVACNE